MAPRRVHELFAHRLLPQTALDPDTDLFAEASAVDLGPRLVQLWDEVNRRVDPHETIAPEGLAAYLVMVPELSGVLIALPEATEPDESRFAMLVAHSDPTKRLFFTSERTTGADGDRPAVLNVWVPSESGIRQVNLGPRDDPGIDAFVTDVMEAASL